MTTAYEKFVADCKKQVANDPTSYNRLMADNGVFPFQGDINLLIKLNYKMSCRMMVHLFGQQLGEHLWNAFSCVYSGNLLRFFGYLHSEQRFYIIHQLKTDSQNLFMHE